MPVDCTATHSGKSINTSVAPPTGRRPATFLQCQIPEHRAPGVGAPQRPRPFSRKQTEIRDRCFLPVTATLAIFFGGDHHSVDKRFRAFDAANRLVDSGTRHRDHHDCCRCCARARRDTSSPNACWTINSSSSMFCLKARALAQSPSIGRGAT